MWLFYLFGFPKLSEMAFGQFTNFAPLNTLLQKSLEVQLLHFPEQSTKQNSWTSCVVMYLRGVFEEGSNLGDIDIATAEDDPDFQVGCGQFSSEDGG